MITKASRPDGLWQYVCDTCGTVRVVRFADLRNPCPCPIQPIQEIPYVAPVEPSLAVKAANFSKAVVRHAKAGRPQATDEQVAERFAICVACPLFKPIGEGEGVCTHNSCGCDLKAVGLKGRNKLRWADQECPDTPPKWTRIS